MSRSQYGLSYQTSPIVLVGGIAGTGMLPLISLLSSKNYSGVTSSASGSGADSTFGQFRPLPGHTLMDNDIAQYPVANQTVAANAIITNPLRVSLEMLVPAGGAITLSNKLSIITSLKSSLDNHTAQGGWYNVATPSYIYQGCLLISLTDASDDIDGAQPQVRWIWEFSQPLLTAAAAQAAQNQAMAKIANKTKNAGDPPGSQPIASGLADPASNLSQNVVPASSGLAGANVTPTTTTGGTPSARSISPIAPGG